MRGFRSIGLALVLLGVALVAFPTWAKVDQAAVGKGTSELGVALSWMQWGGNVKSDGDKGSQTNSHLSGVLNYGYFLTKALELGAEVTYSTQSVEYGGDMSYLGTKNAITLLYDAKFTYNFILKGAPALLPFAAVKVGEFSYHETGMESGGSGLTYGGALGLRYFVSRQGSLDLEFNYDYISPFQIKDKYGTTDVDNASGMTVLVGTSIFIGGKK